MATCFAEIPAFPCNDVAVASSLDAEEDEAPEGPRSDLSIELIDGPAKPLAGGVKEAAGKTGSVYPFAEGRFCGELW